MPVQYVPTGTEGAYLVFERGALIGRVRTHSEGGWQASRPNAGGEWSHHSERFPTREAAAEWLTGEAFMGGHEQP